MKVDAPGSSVEEKVEEESRHPLVDGTLAFSRWIGELK